MASRLKRYNLQLLLMILLFCISCDKKEGERHTIVNGSVSDFYSNEPLSNIGLIIEECEYVLIAPTKCTIIDTIFSDNLGHFNFDLTSYYSEELLDVSYYQISVIVSDNYANSGVQKIAIEKLNNFDFKIKPLRVLKITLLDTSMIYDELRISISESNYNEINQFYQRKTVINPDENEFVFFNFVPQTDHSISWEYYRLGEYKGYQFTHRFFDYIDTSYFEIKY